MGAQGHWPSEVVGRCRGEPHKVDPRNGGDLLGPKEGVHPVPRLGRRNGEAGHGRCPVGAGGGDSQDLLRVSAGRDGKDEQGSARALLTEDLPSVVGPPGPEEGGGTSAVGPSSRAHGWQAGGRGTRWAL